MNADKQAAFAVVGAMHSVVVPAGDAVELSDSNGMKSAVDAMRASTEIAAAYVGAPGKDDKEIVIRHAESVLEFVGDLPKSHRIDGVARQLDFMREAAKQLRAMLKLYRKPQTATQR